MVLKIYRLTKNFSNDEKYGLVSQIRRSASSVPTNIIEGAGRRNPKEFMHFLNISAGSCEEVKYQLLLSKDLGYINLDTYDEYIKKYKRISSMRYKLIESMKNVKRATIKPGGTP
ncbi:MAG: four helix bundle protein [Spirochaetes bacterium]|nr:four helix bundle protein [Spirochaetota bacterium]